MKKLWIYQSNRFLSDAEVAHLSERLTSFVQQWSAHGNQLAGSFEIKHNLFICLMVDEKVAQVTGCSIDKSVNTLKSLAQEVGVDLFDRLQIAYRDNQTGIINVVPSTVFQELMDQGQVNLDTIVFNNMLTDAQDLATAWEVPVKDSWHAKVYA